MTADPLVAVAAGLYGGPTEQFVAARAAAAREARAAGDRDLARAVAALRRPSGGAAAANLLVRERPEDVGRLLDLGVRLREAQAALAGSDLRALHAEQQHAMAEVLDAALADVAARGGGSGPAVRARLEGTLRAAMGDADAAAALATGLLTRDLTSSGFEPVDVTDAIAVPGAPALTGVPARRTPLRAVPAPTPPAPAPAPRRRRGRLITEEPPTRSRPAASAPVAEDRATTSRAAQDRATKDRSAADRAAEDRAAERRAAARRAAAEEVAAARAEADARAADRDAAERRVAEVEAQATDLDEQVTRTRDEIARLREVLATTQQAARAAAVEARHARTARDGAVVAAERAASRLRVAQQRDVP